VFRTSAEVRENTFGVALLVSTGSGVAVVEVTAEDAVDEDGEFPIRSGVGLGLADAVGDAALEGAESRGSASDTHGAHAQEGRGVIAGALGLGVEEATAGDLVVRGHSQPGREVLFGGPPGHVGSDPGDELECGAGVDRIDRGEIRPAGEAMEERSDLQAGLVALRLPLCSRRGKSGLGGSDCVAISPEGRSSTGG
jgi:hypothetical protein